jgi:hypothetical protein
VLRLKTSAAVLQLTKKVKVEVKVKKTKTVLRSCGTAVLRSNKNAPAKRITASVKVEVE